LEGSEELGNLIRPHDVHLALKVFKAANVHNKVMECMMETGSMD